MDCHVVFHMVGDNDDDPVPFARVDGRPRVAPIDCDHGFCMAQSAHVSRHNLPGPHKQNRNENTTKMVNYHTRGVRAIQSYMLIKSVYSHRIGISLYQLVHQGRRGQ